MQSQESKLNEIIAEELCCSVCMCLFRNPVTIECGHTFCRSCLLNYTRAKMACPICRTALAHVPEHPNQDSTIAKIVQYVRQRQLAISKQANLKQTKQEKGETSLQHFENLLLIDVRCSERELLLPYTKIKATFQLQSPTLLSKLQRFVARQQIPFNKLGIVSKITYLNQLRHNIYECTIQGKSFCVINNEQIEKQEEQNQEYFYRVCQAKIIYEDEEIKSEWHEKFLGRFMQIKDKNILKTISKVIDPQKLFSKTNPMATYYSIMRILAEPNEKKYEVIASFDQQKRQQFLRNFLTNLPNNISKCPQKLITVRDGSPLGIFVFLLFVVLGLVVVLAFNNDYSQL